MHCIYLIRPLFSELEETMEFITKIHSGHWEVGNMGDISPKQQWTLQCSNGFSPRLSCLRSLVDISLFLQIPVSPILLYFLSLKQILVGLNIFWQGLWGYINLLGIKTAWVDYCILNGVVIYLGRSEAAFMTCLKIKSNLILPSYPRDLSFWIIYVSLTIPWHIIPKLW